jgi:hypothetical protein
MTTTASRKSVGAQRTISAVSQPQYVQIRRYRTLASVGQESFATADHETFANPSNSITGGLLPFD